SLITHPPKSTIFPYTTLFRSLPKKEVAEINKEYDRLMKFLGGIRDMKEMPKALFVVDPRKESIAINEAKILGIPVVAMVDTRFRSEEHTSELQSRFDLVCRLL